MPRKPEPHELRAAKMYAFLRWDEVWEKLGAPIQRSSIADARRILRAAGRGGKELSRRIVFDPEGECSCEPKSWLDGHPPCHGTCRRVLILDLGPARKRRGRNG